MPRGGALRNFELSPPRSGAFRKIELSLSAAQRRFEKIRAFSAAQRRLQKNRAGIRALTLRRAAALSQNLSFLRRTMSLSVYTVLNY